MDIYYTDAPTIDESPLYPWPAAEPGKRGLRNWHKFVLTYGLAMTGLALLLRELVLRTGGNEAGGLVVVAGVAVIALLISLVILAIAWRFDRL
jgi:hypothetical protein